MIDQSKNNMNTAKDVKKGGIADKIGDGMEALGDRVSRAGMPGIGKKIHDAGDKLETSHKNPNHSSISKDRDDQSDV